jgi:hypothetical protein
LERAITDIHLQSKPEKNISPMKKWQPLPSKGDCIVTAAAPGEAPKGRHVLGAKFENMGDPLVGRETDIVRPILNGFVEQYSLLPLPGLGEILQSKK